MAMLGAVWRKANRWIAAGLGAHCHLLFLSLLNLTDPSPITVAYIAFLSSLVLEPVQRALIYLHPLRIPFGTDFSKPELVGFSPGKVLPFNLTTHDGAVLGAWQVLPSDVYAQAVESSRQGGGALQDGPLPQSVFDAALA